MKALISFLLAPGILLKIGIIPTLVHDCTEVLTCNRAIYIFCLSHIWGRYVSKTKYIVYTWLYPNTRVRKKREVRYRFLLYEPD